MSSLAPALLLSMPQLLDPNFTRSVVLLCKHSEEGAFGLVLCTTILPSLLGGGVLLLEGQRHPEWRIAWAIDPCWRELLQTDEANLRRRGIAMMAYVEENEATWW